MLIVGCCSDRDTGSFAARTRPRLSADDELHVLPPAPGICGAYNRLIDMARERPDCEALVLIHDDVEIIDDNFRGKVLREAGRPGRGVTGVVGAVSPPGLAWWEARRKAGVVFETRGAIVFDPRPTDVDCVDGMFMVLSPAAFRTLRFDERSFPAFHGYDVDFCLQARVSGLAVRTARIDLVHRTKGGYGDTGAFAAADRALRAKWSDPRPATPVSDADVGGPGGEAPDPPTPPEAPDDAPDGGQETPETGPVRCPVCGTAAPEVPPGEPQRILTCEGCGTGLTVPPPARASGTDEIFEDSYGGSRVQRRNQWRHEARARLDWMMTWLPEGDVIEIGSATGEFVEALEAAGYYAVGLEPSPWAAREAAAVTANVECVDLDTFAARTGIRFHAAALWHVIEHVEDPVGFLASVAGVLAPGGMLFAEVPNFASAAAARLGARWEHAFLHEHRWHFTPDSLGRLLTRTGWTVRHLVTVPWRIYDGTEGWLRRKNAAVLEGHPWPDHELLRVVATAP